MAINSSAVGLIAKNMNVGLNVLADYITAGAVNVSEKFNPANARVGEKVKVCVDNITAYEFGGSTALQDGLTSTYAELELKNFGYKIANKQLEAKLMLGDGAIKDISKNGARAIAKRATDSFFVADMQSGADIVIAENASEGAKTCAKMIMKTAAELNEKYSAKVFGLTSAPVKADVLSLGYKETGIDVNGIKGRAWEIGDVQDMRNVALPRNGVGATSSAISAGTTLGSSVTLSGATAGAWYVFKKSNTGLAIVVATSTSAGKLVYLKGAIDASTTAETDAFYPCVLRAEGAQCYADASSMLDADRIEGNEGFKVAYNDHDTGSFTKDMEWGSALLCGVGNKDAVKILLLKV